MASGRVFNSKDWTDVVDSEVGNTGNKAPVLPILDGDGKIFVSIPSFRDGERCAKTLVDLFTKAKDPDNLVVGIIDQSYEEDHDCLESYCKEMGTDIYRKVSLRNDTTKVIAKPTRGECPRIDQIRKLSVHNVAAKGPVWARSMVRKIMGDEEFCLQIDSHTDFAQDWDDKVKHEWAATGNEFGVISTVPTGLGDIGGDAHTVPRNCVVRFLEVGVPGYSARGDGKVVNLKRPLLSHTWCAGFSFSKCHLEESVPYDPFTPYVMGVEQFSRFVRMWTRGYDVYTPTQNIIYHDYQPNADGHGIMEWMRPRYERFRRKGIERIRSYLGLPGGLEGLNLSNLGIYGLGKRRTLKQMADFVDIDMETQRSRPPNSPCGNNQWVPYDANISPVDNLHDQPDDLDPQPEFPLRAKFIFYNQDEAVMDLEMLEGDVFGQGDAPNEKGAAPPVIPATSNSPFPSATLLLLLWIVGLIAWCAVFVGPSSGSKNRPRQKKQIRKDIKSV